MACPLGNVQTSGRQTPREKKLGCGDIPGPTGMPARKAGGCPWIGTAENAFFFLHFKSSWNTLKENVDEIFKNIKRNRTFY